MNTIEFSSIFLHATNNWTYIWRPNRCYVNKIWTKIFHIGCGANGIIAWDSFRRWWTNIRLLHYCDVIMGAVASQITSLKIVYYIVYSDEDQRKIKAVREIPRSPGNSPHKWPVTRKMFPFDDVIMINRTEPINHLTHASDGSLATYNGRLDETKHFFMLIICLMGAISFSFWFIFISSNCSYCK